MEGTYHVSRDEFGPYLVRLITPKREIEVQVGTHWRDLDPRSKGRIVEVRRLYQRGDDWYALVARPIAGARTTSLRIARMYNHSAGWIPVHG